MIARTPASARIRAALLTLLALLVLLSAGCSQLSRPWGDVEIADGAPIRIGVLTDVAGTPTAQPLSATKTIDGHPLELVAVPVKCGGPAAVSAPDPAALEGLAGVIGAACSSACIYSESLLSEQNTTLLAAGCTAAAVTQSGYGLSFRVAWNDADQATVAADYARSALHARTAAVLSDRSAYSRAMLAAYRTEFKRRGGTTVVEVDLPSSGDVDVPKLVSQVEASGAQAVLLAIARPDAGGYYARFNSALAGRTLIATDTVLAAPKSSSAGAIVGAPAGGATLSADSTDASNRAWLVAAGTAREKGVWTSEVKVDPATADLFATQQADALAIYERAIREVARPGKNGSLAIPRRALRDAIARLQITGETGRIAFDAGGERRHDIGAAVYRVQDGRPAQVAVYTR